MPEKIINEDYLLLLINNNGFIEATTVDINKHFLYEPKKLQYLCSRPLDNLNEIIQFIRTKIQVRVPNKVFNYCKKLDKPNQRVIVYIEKKIKDFINLRDKIYEDQKIAIENGDEFKFVEVFAKFKENIRQQIEVWFKAFDIDFAYEQAKKTPNMLVYSHRISGWSNPEYNITNNLKQQIKTNFGFGNASYFYSLLTFKNVEITPVSEWIDYRYALFSEVIRYTRSFGKRIPIFYNGELKYYKVEIANSSWISAITFTQDAANLSLTDEDIFIKEYIIDECERMVNGLENILKESKFKFLNQDQIQSKGTEELVPEVDIKGFELIDFRTEKIIGALDFIDKIREYDSITPSKKYEYKIIELNKKFIPNVYPALKNQKFELSEVEKKNEIFLLTHNRLIEKEKIYENERFKLRNDFYLKYKDEYKEFQETLKNSKEIEKKYLHKIKLHRENIKRLQEYIDKYNSFMNDYDGLK